MMRPVLLVLAVAGCGIVLISVVGAVFIGGMVTLLTASLMSSNQSNPYPELASLRTDHAAVIRPADGVPLWTYELERTTTIEGEQQAADLSFAYGTNETDGEALTQMVSSLGSPARQTYGPPPIRASALFCRDAVAVYVTIADPTLSEVVRDVRRTKADPKRFRAIAIVSLTAANYAQHREACRGGESPRPTR